MHGKRSKKKWTMKNKDMSYFRLREKEFNKYHGIYNIEVSKYQDFLDRSGQANDYAEHLEKISACQRLVKQAMDRYDGQLQKILETMSNRSEGNRSNTSDTGKRLKTSRRNVEFARKEATMMKQQAALEHQLASMKMDIEVLKKEKEQAMAEMEAENVEMLSSSDSENSDYSQERTRQYVQSNCIGNHGNSDTSASEFTRYLLKKDLMMGRLTEFSGRPEDYAVWKNEFQSVMDELDVDPRGELDLLVKYIGTDSKRHAISIRASQLKDPGKGVALLWERMDERYDGPELIESALHRRLHEFPKLFLPKDNSKLYELSDLLTEIENMKSNQKFKALLSYFDTSSGINPIIQKLPSSLQEQWTRQAFRYKETHGVSYPPFSFFAKFVKDTSKIKNDPSFNYAPLDSKPVKTPFSFERPVRTKKTEVSPKEICPYHNTDTHSLNQCLAFKDVTFGDKKDFLKSKGYCYRCCGSNNHLARDCNETIICEKCNSGKHPTFMHMDNYVFRKSDEEFTTKCTQVCGGMSFGKSCSKTVLANIYPSGDPSLSIKAYVVIDDQSNASLATTELLDHFGMKGDNIPYTISSCAGTVRSSCRRANSLILESLDGENSLELSSAIECNEIPNLRDEIPTPEIAVYHKHLKDIAHNIPPLDADAEIMLLVGRDLVEAHHVLDHRIGPRNSPYAQKLPLGWVVVGETCLGKIHKPSDVVVNKTFLWQDGRTSLFEPCPNKLTVKQNNTENVSWEDSDNSKLFERSKEDEKSGTSVEDRQFLSIMDEEMCRDSDGHWTAPLPFKCERRTLPNNRAQAMKRAMTLDRSLHRDPVKKEHFFTFMQKVFDSEHAELAPPLDDDDERWYLPIFGVYHPKKPGQIRAVFDSSAQFDGVSLNDVLLTGPDLTNDLLGVLLRFRREEVAVMADIQSMFHCFKVKQEHRNFLRFMWYRDNNFDNDLVEYRMKVHVFGNRPSPAVATYGLRRAAEEGELYFGHEVKSFVDKDFYVDDAVTSLPSVEQAVGLLKKAQQCLQENGKLRLHKVVSNRTIVMQAFSTDDLAKDLQDLNLSTDPFPLQRSLGILWDIKQDAFTFDLCQEEQPYTKRGVLSTVNSLFDPMGFVAPVLIKGKTLLREAGSESGGWDDRLSPELKSEWGQWRSSLHHLRDLQIPRMSVPTSFVSASTKNIHVFTDASTKAIASVAYLRTVDKEGNEEIGFILGKAKLAPKHGHTIPRLELCAAVLATEIATLATDHLDLQMSDVHYYSDSKIVLGYLNNTSRRFSVYVSNRIQKVRNVSSPDQWSYVPTDRNPADSATRSVPADKMGQCLWLKGPTAQELNEYSSQNPQFDEAKEDCDTDIVSLTTSVKVSHTIGCHRFKRFSDWSRLVKTIARLKLFARHYHKCSERRWNSKPVDSDTYVEAENFMIKALQWETYQGEITCIADKCAISNQSPILSLNPFLDDEGLLRVGGRLKHSSLKDNEKHPIIIPGKSDIAKLLVRHHPIKLHHQGRHLTEGAIRSAGLWITGGKRLISSVLHQCVQCRKLRGKQEHQIMADLPGDRLTPSPPFSYVGVDTFGPWTIASRRTRGGLASSKRWALLFTCLTTRAVHIEVIEDMTASSFINALRRFISIRGNIVQFRSDRGTNFIGSTDILGVNSVNVEDEKVRQFMVKQKTQWIFNPPYASHMGGVWERLIGVVRRILDGIMSSHQSSHKLTHEILVTFMAEVCAIVYGRPITPVSTDPEDASILSPSSILTQKTNHVVTPLLDNNGDLGSLYKNQWRHVQRLSDTFWKRWRSEYLQTLQSRRKWRQDRQNVSNGDFVLLRDKTLCRNEWPCGVIVNAIKSDDGLVRKAIVKVVKDGKPTTFTRPITEIVVLLSAELVECK